MKISNVLVTFFVAVIQTPIIHTFIVLLSSEKDPYASRPLFIKVRSNEPSSRTEIWMGICLAYVFYWYVFLSL